MANCPIVFAIELEATLVAAKAGLIASIIAKRNHFI
jgi:hypothetical protein